MLNWIVRKRTDYLYQMDLVLNNLQMKPNQPTESS